MKGRRKKPAMGNEERRASRCPWCDELFSPVGEAHQGSHGKMKILRCSKCRSLISVRLEGEPDRFLRKDLISGELP